MVVGDAKYGSIPNIVGLQADGIRPYLATGDYTKRSNVDVLEDFRYDAEQNGYGCPEGHFLPLSSYDRHSEGWFSNHLK